MFTHIILLLFKAAPSICLAGYELFPGFGVNYKATTDPEDSWVPNNAMFRQEVSTTTTVPPQTKSTTTEPPNFECPEDEKPSNIGPYEVPTEKDLVVLVRKSLVKRFQRYNKKALLLLKDFKEAYKSASLQTNNCVGDQKEYRNCLRKVNRHCSSITKNMMTMIEGHKRNITFFRKSKICNMAAMKTDPLKMVKILAVEEATLKFALPAFLRLIHACQVHCISNYSITKAQKPRRRLSDQEFVVKHILTKNPVDLIKDSK